MSLSIRLEGFEYTGFKNAQVVRGIEMAASTFSFTATAQPGDVLPVKEGDLVEIIADNKYVLLTGWIDTYSIKYDSRSHAINIKGRSLTQDLIDSTVPPIKGWENLSLFQIAKKIADNFNVGVVDAADQNEIFIAVFGGELGQSALEFIEQFARQRQVLLTDDTAGNLVLMKPSTDVATNVLNNVIDGKANNIIGAHRSLNLANLFGTYIAQIQGYPIEVSDFDNIEELVEFADFATDPAIRPTRIYEFYAEEVININTIDQKKILEERALWEVAIRRARNFKYKVTVQGHSQNDEPWSEDILYEVVDDYAGLSGQYYCNQITYDYSVESGSTTTLNLVSKNSYTLKAVNDIILIDR